MVSEIDAEVERILLKDYQKFYRLAYSYVKNEQDALDIVQDSAYKAMKDAKKIKNTEFASTWIYRIVVNTSIDYLRRKQREGLYLNEAELVHEDCYQDDSLQEVLKCLGDKERAVIILRFFEEMKLDEIAGILGENVSTIKARLYRTLRKLKAELNTEL